MEKLKFIYKLDKMLSQPKSQKLFVSHEKSR